MKTVDGENAGIVTSTFSVFLFLSAIIPTVSADAEESSLPRAYLEVVGLFTSLG